MASPLEWKTATDWDNAKSQSSVEHPNDVIMLSGWSDGFEDGDMSEWTVSDSTFSTTTSPVYAGSYSFGGADTSGGVTNIADTVVDSTGVKPSSFTFYWYETSNSWGGGIRLKNSNGNWECGATTNNPQWEYWDSGGFTQFYAGDGYKRWIKFKISFDWANGTFDITGEDLSSGSTASATGLTLRSGVDVAEIHIEGYTGSAWHNGGSGGNTCMWFDDMSLGGTASSGSLTTATKTFNNSITPNLGGLQYTLNGGGIDVTVRGSPASSTPETHTITLDGSDHYTISWTNAHSSFDVKFSLSMGSQSPKMDETAVGTFGTTTSLSGNPATGTTQITDYNAVWSLPTHWDNAQSNSGWTHSDDVLENKAAGWFDGFEDGDLAEWTFPNSTYKWSIKTNRIYQGSYSAGAEKSGGSNSTNGIFAEKTPPNMTGGAKPTTFSFYWNEASSQYGAGVWVVNSNGNMECAFATDNPQWMVEDANGQTNVYSGDGYARWIYVEYTFDWTNAVFDVYIEDQKSGSTFSDTGRPLKAGVDMEKLYFRAYAGGTWGNGDYYMWHDNIDVSGYGSNSSSYTSSKQSL